MNKTDFVQVQELLCGVYNGIIANNPISDGDIVGRIQYDFDCPEFVELKEKYHLEEVAGKGTDFARAKRVLNYLSPRLHHSSYYDNHIDCNALALLDYSFENPNQGINCLNKSKILQECLLALGIYARRAKMMPYSPFDMDNHVVVEMYDKTTSSWIMLDPTTNVYVVNKNYKPLSLMEMRELFGSNGLLVPVEANRKKVDLQKQRRKHSDMISYYAKNSFYFTLDECSTFGVKGDVLHFAPKHFHFGQWKYRNAKFRMDYITEHLEELGLDETALDWAKRFLEQAKQNIDKTTELCKMSVYYASPVE